MAEIRLNRPQRLNAVTQQLCDELNHALGRTAFDRRQYLQGEQTVCLRLPQPKRPVVVDVMADVVAAVNGYAPGAGAGAEPATASDFIVMAERAQTSSTKPMPAAWCATRATARCGCSASVACWSRG